MTDTAEASFTASIDEALRPSTYYELPLEDWVEFVV
jgi:hypothetical protein